MTGAREQEKPDSIEVPIDEDGNLLVSHERQGVVFLLPRGRIKITIRNGAMHISGSDGISIGPRSTNAIDIHVGVRS